MLAEERMEKILRIVKSDQYVSIKKLIEITNFSQSTIIRDISTLVKRGQITKVWGGVKFIEKPEPYHYDEKININKDEKIKISQYASKLVWENSTVFIDEGTTMTFLANELKHKKITAVTNSIAVFDILKDNIENLFLIGGLYNTKSKNFTSSIAVEILDKFKFNLCFISIDRLDQSGIYGNQVADCEIKQKVILLSDEKIVLASNSKIGGVGFMRIASLDEVKVFTTKSTIEHKNIIEIGEKAHE